jgi:hypothetical protein
MYTHTHTHIHIYIYYELALKFFGTGPTVISMPRSLCSTRVAKRGQFSKKKNRNNLDEGQIICPFFLFLFFSYKVCH